MREMRDLSRRLSMPLLVLTLFGVGWSSGEATAALTRPIASLQNAAPLREQERQFAEAHHLPTQVAMNRLEWQRLAPELQERARHRLGLRFGGVWIDNENSGRIKLGVVDPGPELLDEAHEAVTESHLAAATDVVEVARSEAELNNILGWLGARLTDANLDAPTSLAFGILPDQNVVRISLPEFSLLTARQSDLVAEAKAIFGAAVTAAHYAGKMRDEACAYPFCGAPLRAGVRVGPSPKVENPELEGWCTGGFLVRGKEDGALYQLTAGHCDLSGNGETLWGTKLTSGGFFKEIGSWEAGFNNESGDAGMYAVADDSVWKARPWVYWYGTSEGYPIFSDANPVKGQTVCKSGAFHGTTTCGAVTEVSVLVEIGGVKKTVSRANYCSEGGDSGSPIHYFGVAYGVHTGGAGECNKYFTHVSAAKKELNVNVRYESVCDPLFESPIKLGDMTGDGKEDIFEFPGSGKGKAWESKGTSYTSLGEIGSGFGSPYQNRVGDMDGDGDDDLFQMTDNGDLYAWESKGSSYTSLGLIAGGFGSACDTRVAYINSDAEVDILRFTNDGYAYGWLADEGEYEELGQVGTGFGSTYQDRSGDMDGDGDDDLFQILDNGTIYKWTSSGSAYTGGSELFSGVGNASQVRFADLEGDGDDDIFRFTDAGVGSLWKSKGSAYEAIGTIGTEFGFTRQMRVADIDGDGDSDVLKFADDGKLYAWTYNGSTFTGKGNISSGFGKP